MKFIKKLNSKKTISILVVSGIVILAITAGQRYRIKPIEDALQYITTPIQKGLNMVKGGSNAITDKFKNTAVLQENNDRLQEEVDKLFYDNTILEQYKNENEELKKLLDLSQRYKEYPSEGANIIAKEPGNWYNVFIIDKGTNAGFNKDDAILAGGGLVGHIIESGPLTSKVLSIIDDRSSVSATVLRTNETGILKGDIELTQQGYCKFEIDIQSEIIKGDQIITSHLSDIYPPGITVGIVEDVLIAKNGLIQYAYVRPVVDFKHLKQVLILKTKGS